MLRSEHYTPDEIATLLSKEKNIYFIGIGGVSMSSLAEITAKAGCRVAGSDRVLSALTDALTKDGIKVYEGHNAENCRGFTVFAYNSAIHEDNPEYAYAKKNGYTLIHRADLLGYVVTFFDISVGVAGTHGKSTSTAMLGSALEAAGLDPTVLNGAVMRDINSTYRRGSDKCLCFEACEYTDSFLSFYPKIALVLNIGYDHADYFKTANDYIASFKKYISQSPCAVVNVDSESGRKAVQGYTGKLVTCSLNGSADVYAENLNTDGLPEFDAMYKGKKYAHIKLGVYGMHNVCNALCCIGACIMLGIDGGAAAEGISKFKGVARRFELKGEYNGAKIYDDYAHHPDEIKATLSIARKCTKGRLYVAFQSHTYSRTKKFYTDFINAFESCDEVIYCDIYPAREVDTLGMSAEKLAADTSNGVYKGDFHGAAAYLKSILKPDDAAVIMGAGNANAVIIQDLIK
ncbi:MAG: UDP-N-acetylmuramate--L-alanine ligase [Clostridia bacterium]|nr:UDP-N-acetylmuramate--L-alanine ligase [Clostridia bacterium]